MMKDAIKDFATQFSFIPEIVNSEKLVHKNKFIVCGMGGSHLAADVLKDVMPDLRMYVHRMYGLPAWRDEELENSLVIASSYSGNTEEVIDAYNQALEKKLSLCVVAVGGELIKKAKADGVPYIQIPDTGIQPRSALGYSFLSLLTVIGHDDMLHDAKKLAVDVNPESLEQAGKDLADKLSNKIPVIYTSDQNYSVAYNWKIKFNETGKIPAFCNVLPELNHNEMTGFDPVLHENYAEGDTYNPEIKKLSDSFSFIFIKDKDDHERVLHRMDILKKLYKDRGLPVEIIEMPGSNRLERIFNSLVLADWAAVYIAEKYGLESEEVPMVEEFKGMMK